MVKPTASSSPESRMQMVGKPTICTLDDLHRFLTENRATVIPPKEVKQQVPNT